MSASDIRYGRRGGGWIDGDPTSWRDEFAKLRAANGGELRPGDHTQQDDEQLGLFE